MKRIFLIAVALAALSGCATKLPNGQVQTPAQIAAQFCPVLQPSLQSLNLLIPDPRLATASDVVGVVCKFGATVTTGNLQAIAGQVFPDILSVVRERLPVDKQTKYILDVSIAQVFINGFLALNPPLTSIGTSIPASAPK